MSGRLKNFFDRFTELITAKKHIGRQIKGKSTYVLAVGADESMPPGFDVPFRVTSEYLNMNFKGNLYYSTKHLINKNPSQEQINNF
jgi:hypothetical protein